VTANSTLLQVPPAASSFWAIVVSPAMLLPV
jgi:hypothetical protein